MDKDHKFGQGSVSVVGITRNFYGRPQYFLVEADEGRNSHLKIPGLRFRVRNGRSLEEIAADRFREQTGFNIDKMLGLRAVVPARSRHGVSWNFQNVFFGIVDSPVQEKNDGRMVYLSDPGQGVLGNEEYVGRFGNFSEKRKLIWANQNDRVVARTARKFLSHFNWERQDTDHYRRINCMNVTVPPEKELYNNGDLGCGLAVSSMILLYQETPYSEEKVIMVQRKGDIYPGYAGGKIETPISTESSNIDPVSCCIEEGRQEYGFEVTVKGLIGVSITPLDFHDSERQYSGLLNYSFFVVPTNPLKVAEALKNPEAYIEPKMEGYVVETLDEHRDRILRGELRSPDMILAGNRFYGMGDGEFIPLSQFVSSGSY